MREAISVAEALAWGILVVNAFAGDAQGTVGRAARKPAFKVTLFAKEGDGWRIERGGQMHCT